MQRAEPSRRADRGLVSRQMRILLLGLVAILVPVSFVLTHVKSAHKSVHSAVTDLTPIVAFLGGVGAAIVSALLILAVCWILGWVVGRTRRGRQWITWEKAKLLPKSSPLLREEMQKFDTTGDGKQAAAAPAAPPVTPALAHVEGGWQPGAIVEAREDGWATVFVPTVPDLSTGRLFCLPGAQVRRLEVPLDEFRKRLLDGGHGTGNWLSILAGPGHDRSGAPA